MHENTGRGWPFLAVCDLIKVRTYHVDVGAAAAAFHDAVKEISQGMNSSHVSTGQIGSGQGSCTSEFAYDRGA